MFIINLFSSVESYSSIEFNDKSTKWNEESSDESIYTWNFRTFYKVQVKYFNLDTNVCTHTFTWEKKTFFSSIYVEKLVLYSFSCNTKESVSFICEVSFSLSKICHTDWRARVNTMFELLSLLKSVGDVSLYEDSQLILLYWHRSYFWVVSVS